MSAAAELDKIAAEAQADELAAVPDAPLDGAAPAAPVVSLDAELSGLVTMLVTVLGPAFPSLKTIYTPEAIGAASAAVAAVCTKHGWLSGGVMGEWGEEITAALIVVPLAIATANGIKADIAARKPKAAEAVSAVIPPASPESDAPVASMILQREE